jgi:hydroxyacylglutathione hydrolase
MDLLALPAFADNYIWLLHDGQRALVVDPGDAAPVLAWLDNTGLELAAILVTHHHADHVGGVDALRPRLTGPVYGPAREKIPVPFVALNEGDHADTLGLRFEVIDVPGHTAGHIAYWQAQHKLLFCGDTLFSAGCGRLFEGTPKQMSQSLAKLSALPGEARVCCTHEYTLSNLRFAAAVEPDNRDRLAYDAWCREQRTNGLPTLPSNIALERRVNPFLRCSEPAVVAAASARDGRDAGANDPVSVLATLREWKNQFR